MSYGIQDEDDLQFHLMKTFGLGEFAKVNRISTIEISPDIDLLDVNESQKLVTGYEFKLLKYRKNWKKVDLNPVYQGIGQALSYLNFGVDKSYLVLGLSREIPNESLSRAMKKIEETIAVFNMLKTPNVERVNKIGEAIGEVLGAVLEIEEKANLYKVVTPSTLPMLLQDIQVKLLILSKSLKKEISGIGCFGIKVWTEHDDILITRLETEETFPISSYEDLQHKKRCLLRKEFKYDKDFLNRMEKRVRLG